MGFYCIFKQQFTQNMAKMLLFAKMPNFLPIFSQNAKFSALPPPRDSRLEEYPAEGWLHENDVT